jgi:hypothetical protein
LNGIEQVGWARWINGNGDTNLQYIAEWYMCGNCQDHQKEVDTLAAVGTINGGDVDTYKSNRFESGDGQVRMEVCQLNTTTCSVMLTGDDPYSNGWTNDDMNGEVYGETGDLKTDMPGVQNNQASARQVQVKLGSNWSAIDWTRCPHHTHNQCGVDSNPNRYHFDWNTSNPNDSFNIWTDPT